ncbi:MAG: hypothetical protein K2M73_07980 [Lachnospiraceae bacterium]|nr:hypothetical protein [Lachnospiraceae bacterium]
MVNLLRSVVVSVSILFLAMCSSGCDSRYEKDLSYSVPIDSKDPNVCAMEVHTIAGYVNGNRFETPNGVVCYHNVMYPAQRNILGKYDRIVEQGKLPGYLCHCFIDKHGDTKMEFFVSKIR